MTVSGPQYTDALFRAGYVQKASAAQPGPSIQPDLSIAAAAPAAGPVMDEVEKSLLSGIKSAVAQLVIDLGQYLDESEGAGESAIEILTPQPGPSHAVPDIIVSDITVTDSGAQNAAAFSPSPTLVTFVEPAATPDSEATDPAPLPPALPGDRAETVETATQGLFKVLVAKAHEIIHAIVGAVPIARTVEKAAAAAEGAELPPPVAGADIARAAPSAVVEPASSSPEEGPAHLQVRPAAEHEERWAAEAFEGPAAGHDVLQPLTTEEELGAVPVPQNRVPTPPTFVPQTGESAAVPLRAPEKAQDVSGAIAPYVPIDDNPIDNSRGSAVGSTISQPSPKMSPTMGASPTTIAAAEPPPAADPSSPVGIGRSTPLYGQGAPDAFAARPGSNAGERTEASSFSDHPTTQATPETHPANVPARTPNDAIISRILRFVEEINAIVGGNTDDAGMQADEPAANGAPEASQPVHAGIRTAHALAGEQAVVKQVFSRIDASQVDGSAGISVEGNGALHVNTLALASRLSSDPEKTITAVREFANSVSNRIDGLANPFAGAYMSYNNVLQMTAVRGNEKSSPDQELAKEQDTLEERLNELRLLIEKSTLVTNWLEEQVADCDGYGEDAG